MFNLKLLIPIFVILANAFILYYVTDMEKENVNVPNLGLEIILK